MAVIAEEGVSAATFEAIGQRAGYSRGLATQHFGSKQGLIDAVVNYAHEQQDEVLESAHLDELFGLDALLKYVSGYCGSLQRSEEPKSSFMLLSDAVADAQETRAVFAQSNAKVKTRLAKLIRRGQSDGSVRKDVDPESAALMVGSLLLGVSIQSLIDPRMRIGPIERSTTTFLKRSFAPAVRKTHG